MTPAQRRLLAAVEVALPYLPDEVCDEETQRFMALAARVAPKPTKRADLEEGRETRELGSGPNLERRSWREIA
jgi:hypothetical protein